MTMTMTKYKLKKVLFKNKRIIIDFNSSSSLLIFKLKLFASALKIMS
jgi:hypothetical protein